MNSLRSYLFAGILLLTGWPKTHSQVVLQISYPEQVSAWGQQQRLLFADTLSMHEALNSKLADLHREGYLLATIDKLINKGDYHEAFINPGEIFSLNITGSNVQESILRQQKLEHLNRGLEIPYPDLEKIRFQLISWYENNGYPFARVFLDQVTIQGSAVSGVLIADPMGYFTFDSLQLQGNVKLSQRFLSHHTGIRQGEAFNRQLASRSGDQLSRLPFLRLAGNPTLTFRGQKAILSVPVEARKANQFDGIAGLSGSGTEADPYRLNGMLNLMLTNALERGENLSINWQGMGQGTQRLELDISYPYLLSTPLTAGLSFSLHKQDSSYISLSRRPQFSFRSAAHHWITAFADIRSTNVLNPSASQTSAPMDTRTVLYGMQLSGSSPSFAGNPRQGGSYSLGLAAGNRSIKTKAPSSQQPIQDMKPRQSQIMLAVHTELRHAVSNSISLVNRFESRAMLGQQLFENELFRIGGFRSLRGFDEESIFASAYGYVSQELRFFTGEMSFASLLFNLGWFEKKTAGHYQRGWPWGAGAGLNVSTAPGILSVYYVLGKQPDLPFSFRQARIHVGLISLF